MSDKHLKFPVRTDLLLWKGDFDLERDLHHAEAIRELNAFRSKRSVQIASAIHVCGQKLST
jgi:hypothetical protein